MKDTPMMTKVVRHVKSDRYYMNKDKYTEMDGEYFVTRPVDMNGMCEPVGKDTESNMPYVVAGLKKMLGN